MKRSVGIALLAGGSLGILLAPPRLCAQSCKDEEGMVTDYKKDMTDLVEVVKKESLSDFERAYHQRSSLSKLTLYGGIVDALLGCLEKAEQDSTATKDQVEAYKGKSETYKKLKDKILGDRKALKAAEVPKDAKALIAKFDLAM
jgi:hypothetical protein